MVYDGEFVSPANLHIDADAIVGGDAEIRFGGVTRVRAVSARAGSDMFIATFSL